MIRSGYPKFYTTSQFQRDIVAFPERIPPGTTLYQRVGLPQFTPCGTMAAYCYLWSLTTATPEMLSDFVRTPYSRYLDSTLIYLKALKTEKLDPEMCRRTAREDRAMQFPATNEHLFAEIGEELDSIMAEDKLIRTDIRAYTELQDRVPEMLRLIQARPV